MGLVQFMGGPARRLIIARARWTEVARWRGSMDTVFFRCDFLAAYQESGFLSNMTSAFFPLCIRLFNHERSFSDIRADQNDQPRWTCSIEGRNRPGFR
jgi:hypothetical protein